MPLFATGFGALAAGLARWELWTLPVEPWFTSAQVCLVSSLVEFWDHVGMWRRKWALPMSLSSSWVAASFGLVGWDSTVVRPCPSQMVWPLVLSPPLWWLQPLPCWHGWPSSAYWRASQPALVLLWAQLQARCRHSHLAFQNAACWFPSICLCNLEELKRNGYFLKLNS